MYFLVPPAGDYTDVITHVNLGDTIYEKIIKIKLFFISQGRSAPLNFHLENQYK